MLLGRGPQKHALSSALAQAAAGRGLSVLLTGPPGSGFTALLEEAAATAEGAPEDWLVVRARAAADEAGLEHALLQQVVSPLLDRLDAEPGGGHGGGLGRAPRAALESAVGARAAEQPQVPVAMAALGALEVLARRRPVLVVVDDGQWADPASAAVLRFVSRRLARLAVCLLLVLPEPSPAAPPGGAWADGTGTDRTLALRPLEDGDALTWVDDEQPGLDPLRRTALLELAAGLPRRLADLLRADPRQGADPWPGAVLASTPLPSAAAARRVLAALPDAAVRRLVARGLLDDPVGEPLVEEVAEAAEVGAPADAAASAPASGAAATGDALLAAVAAADAAPELVSLLRAAWADRLQALAAEAPAPAAARAAAEALRQRVLLSAPRDPALAPDLEAAARALRGVDAQRSGELFALAADLHPHHDDDDARAAALWRAAELADGCGRGERAGALARRAAALAPSDQDGTAARGLRARWSALAALAGGDRAAAARHLEDALAHLATAAGRGGPAVDAASEEAVGTGAALVLVAGRSRHGSPALEAAAARLPAAAAGRLRSAARLALPWHRCEPPGQRQALADVLADLAGAGLPVLRLAADAGRLLGRSEQVIRSCRALGDAWPPTGRAAVDLQLARAAAAADVAGLPEAREHVARARAALRDEPRAQAAVEQAELLLQRLGSEQVPDAAVVEADDPAPSTERAGALWCRAHEHRLRGDLAAAAALLLPLWPDPGEPPGAGALLNALPLAHALRESGAGAAAVQRVVADAEAWASGSGAPLAVSTALVCRAVACSDPAEQQVLLERAVEVAGPGPTAGAPNLALGMLLRRSRHGVSSRGPLSVALRVFEDHGQRAFAELARRELEATAPVRPQRPMGSSELTGQERTVAALAAKGLSNAEVARSLGISARTVAHHLQHVYAKLGVTGRHHLRSRLEGA